MSSLSLICICCIYVSRPRYVASVFERTHFIIKPSIPFMLYAVVHFICEGRNAPHLYYPCQVFFAQQKGFYSLFLPL
jgi:hypothetical protein